MISSLLALPLPDIIFWATSPIWAFPVTWLLYVLAMHLKRVRDEYAARRAKLHPICYCFAMPVVGVGYFLDAYTNVITMTILLLERPTLWGKDHEWLTTTRLTRWVAHGPSNDWLDNWRYRCCFWICLHMLEPFDKGHCGCLNSHEGYNAYDAM